MICIYHFGKLANSIFKETVINILHSLGNNATQKKLGWQVDRAKQNSSLNELTKIAIVAKESLQLGLRDSVRRKCKFKLNVMCILYSRCG